MKWSLAHKQADKVVMLFDLKADGQKVSNSFDSCAAVQTFMCANGYELALPILSIDSGISFAAYSAKYPLKQDTPKQPTIKRGINRVVPQMRIKTIEAAKPANVPAKPAKRIVKAAQPAKVSEPKQSYKPAKKAANVPAKLDSFKGLQTIGVTNKGNCFNFVFDSANVLRVELSQDKGVCTIVEIESNESKRFRCSKADFSKASVLARKAADCLGFELGAENLPVTVRKATATTAQAANVPAKPAQAANKPAKVAKPANTPKRRVKAAKHQTSQAAFVASKPAFLPILCNTVATLVNTAANVPAKLSECLPTVKPAKHQTSQAAFVASNPAKRIVKAANVIAKPAQRIIDITPIFEPAQIVKDTPKRNVNRNLYRSFEYNCKLSVNWPAMALTVLVCALVCMLFFSGANVPAKPANVVTPAQTVKPANVPAKPANVVKPAKPATTPKRTVRPATTANDTAKPANVEQTSNRADNVSYSTVKQVRKVYKAEKKLLKSDKAANQSAIADSNNDTRKAYRKQLKAAKKAKKAAKKLSKSMR